MFLLGGASLVILNKVHYFELYLSMPLAKTGMDSRVGSKGIWKTLKFPKVLLHSSCHSIESSMVARVHVSLPATGMIGYLGL